MHCLSSLENKLNVILIYLLHKFCSPIVIMFIEIEIDIIKIDKRQYMYRK